MTFATVRFDSRFDVERRAVPRGPPTSGIVVPIRDADKPDAGDEGDIARDRGSARAGEVATHDSKSVRAALGALLRSATFSRSKRHRAFLKYVVDAVLCGRARCLKEVIIGLDVFDRDLDGFDPRRDSIVRVEARRLRAKLALYYRTEGAADPLQIVLQAGSYVPLFLARQVGVARVERPLFMVLPLRAATGGEARGWSIGLADQLVDRLGAIERVRVVATFSAMRLTDGTSHDALRREHGVDYVIDGSIARCGTQLRCTMFLSRTVDRLRLWSQTCDFEVAAPIDEDTPDLLFEIQDRVADAVDRAVRSVID